MNLLKVGVAKTNLEVPIMGGGPLAPRAGNKAREVSATFHNRDIEEAKKRAVEKKELEINSIREAQKRRAVDYGRQTDMGNQYDPTRATSSGMAHVMYDSMKKMGACHFCGDVGHQKATCPSQREKQPAVSSV